MRNIEYYDMHCHFLPGMDDGCRTVEESIDVLISSRRQGIGRICATPHYYPEETVEHFLDRRAYSYEKLLKKMDETDGNFPEICLGAEVAFHTGIAYEEKLSQLCYGKSHYLLLEMPFSSWTPGVLREVRSIHSVFGITPVIAHLERYLKLAGRDAVNELLSMHVLVQMNAEFMENFWNRKRAGNMLKSGIVQVMGSDCHNMTKRPQNLGTVLQYMENHNMAHLVEEIGRVSSRIFSEA
ncbi:MAG: CpsB/CapC family capsule biosynthesis tyrosine phosphatase [Lachnospiraceae bacterium]|nr:CpsB/CapC family capsule biosynthesis tyrosine phosphatase [Lachnospiraceae bacterium]